MEKDDAIRIDGMVMGVQHSLNGIAYYMRNNVCVEECSKLLGSIGESKAALVNLSMALYSAHPDIRPKQPDRSPDDVPELSEPCLEKLVAVRIDGMAISVTANLDGIAHYMKNNLFEEEFSKLVYSIGESMAALLDFKTVLYAAYPDITPKELQPEDEQSR